MNDPLYQLFHLPSLAVRLLLPELVAYNVFVALPVPLSALGMYLFLRRQVAAPASAFGAIAFALAGPIASTTNFPNLSWSIATAPYVFWALDRVFGTSPLLEFLSGSNAPCREPGNDFRDGFTCQELLKNENDERRFIDFARSTMWLGVEHVIIDRW